MSPQLTLDGEELQEPDEEQRRAEVQAKAQEARELLEQLDYPERVELWRLERVELPPEGSSLGPSLTYRAPFRMEEDPRKAPGEGELVPMTERVEVCGLRSWTWYGSDTSHEGSGLISDGGHGDHEEPTTALVSALFYMMAYPVGVLGNRRLRP